MIFPTKKNRDKIYIYIFHHFSNNSFQSRDTRIVVSLAAATSVSSFFNPFLLNGPRFAKANVCPISLTLRVSLIYPEENNLSGGEQPGRGWSNQEKRATGTKRTVGTEKSGTGSCPAWRFAKQCLLSSRSAWREGRKEERKRTYKNVLIHHLRLLLVTLFRGDLPPYHFSPRSPFPPSAFQLFAVSPDFSRLWY